MQGRLEIWIDTLSEQDYFPAEKLQPPEGEPWELRVVRAISPLRQHFATCCWLPPSVAALLPSVSPSLLLHPLPASCAACADAVASARLPAAISCAAASAVPGAASEQLV